MNDSGDIHMNDDKQDNHDKRKGDSNKRDRGAANETETDRIEFCSTLEEAGTFQKENTTNKEGMAENQSGEASNKISELDIKDDLREDYQRQTNCKMHAEESNNDQQVTLDCNLIFHDLDAIVEENSYLLDKCAVSDILQNSQIMVEKNSSLDNHQTPEKLQGQIGSAKDMKRQNISNMVKHFFSSLDTVNIHKHEQAKDMVLNECFAFKRTSMHDTLTPTNADTLIDQNNAVSVKSECMEPSLHIFSSSNLNERSPSIKEKSVSSIFQQEDNKSIGVAEKLTDLNLANMLDKDPLSDKNILSAGIVRSPLLKNADRQNRQPVTGKASTNSLACEFDDDSDFEISSPAVNLIPRLDDTINSKQEQITQKLLNKDSEGTTGKIKATAHTEHDCDSWLDVTFNNSAQFKKMGKANLSLKSAHNSAALVKNKDNSSDDKVLKANYVTNRTSEIVLSRSDCESDNICVPETPIYRLSKRRSHYSRGTNETKSDIIADLKTQINKNQALKRAKKVITNLKTALDSNSSSKDPRIQHLRNELCSIEDKVNVTKTVIAVVGDTGSGKSSLLNALLDQRCILPTSGIRACTAVAVEIEDNTSSNVYEADIEFLTKKEWDQELEILLRDLTDSKGRFRKGAPNADSDTYISYMKVLAVYGVVDTVDKLSQKTNVTKYLGETKTVRSSEPESFQRECLQFITQPKKADKDAEGEFWPIVKMIHFRLPNCDVLKTGAVLVDLPGLKDYNLAREMVSKQFMKNCSTVWIVSSIHRAIDDKTAKTLLGERFRRQLLMDGKYEDVAFICSRTDDLIPSEIIRNLELEPVTQELQQSLHSIKEEKLSLEKIMTEEDDLDDFQSQPRNLRSPKKPKTKKQPYDLSERVNAMKRIRDLNLKLREYSKELHAVCARKRNEYAKEEIKKDFLAGIKDTKRQKDHEDDEELDDYDDDDDEDDDTENKTAAGKLKIFCCSAAEYQKLKHPSPNDGPPQVFSTLEETEIPLLRNYVYQITSLRQSPEIENLVENLGQFVFDHKMQSFIAEDLPLASNYGKEAQTSVDGLIDSWETKFEPVIDTFERNIENDFSSIRKKLEEGAISAEKAACNTCASWGSKKSPNKEKPKTDRKSTNLPYATYKAAVNRCGIYKSPAHGRINFNEDLTDPMYMSLTAVWNRVFNDLINKTFLEMKEQLYAVFDVFTLCLKLSEVGVLEEKGKTIQSEVLCCIMNRLNSMVADLKRLVTNKQREISRMITPHVQECLTPTYRKCQQEHGPGAFQRMKDNLRKVLDKAERCMFSEAVEMVMSELDDLTDDIVKLVRTESKKLLEDLKLILKPLWEDVTCQERPQNSTLRDAILSACSDVCKIYSFAGITKQEHLTSKSSPVPSSGHSAVEVMPCSSQGQASSHHDNDNPIRKQLYGSASSTVILCSEPVTEVSPCSSQQPVRPSPHTAPSRSITCSSSFSQPIPNAINHPRKIAPKTKLSLKGKRSVKCYHDSKSSQNLSTMEKSQGNQMHYVPLSERQQIAMIKTMTVESVQEKDENNEKSTDEPADDQYTENVTADQQFLLKFFPSQPKKKKTSSLYDMSENENQVAQELGTEEKNVDDRKPVKAKTSGNRTYLKRQAETSRPDLPKKKTKLSKQKVSKSNTLDEILCNISKNRVLRRHCSTGHISNNTSCKNIQETTSKRQNMRLGAQLPGRSVDEGESDNLKKRTNCPSKETPNRHEQNSAAYVAKSVLGVRTLETFMQSGLNNLSKMSKDDVVNNETDVAIKTEPPEDLPRVPVDGILPNISEPIFIDLTGETDDSDCE